MSGDGQQRVYPSVPLEVKIDATQQQQPLIASTADATRPPKPPTYEQAIGETTPALTAGPNVVIVTGKWKNKNFKNFFENNNVQCPYCHNFCRTRIRSTPTSRTHLIALLLCLFQLYCCVCLLIALQVA
ncbi:hypothetical protein DOY81_009283 [Sarcophaga bullata]|nr:hypothetical protein DOY81_009283 [Sarcophaga bullata]